MKKAMSTMTKANNTSHIYICMYMHISIYVQSRRAKERQTNLAYMMIDNGGDS